MSLAELLSSVLDRSAAYTAMARIIQERRDVTVATPGLVRPLLVASLFQRQPGPVLVLLAGEDAAERFARQTDAFLKPGQVLRFPERTGLPWAAQTPDIAVVGRRARAIHALSSGRPAIVVASTRSLLRLLPPQGSQVFEPLVLERGSMLDLQESAARLSRMGYERVETARERGQYAVRGGVLDVYPSDSTHPIRAELLGDEIETLRRYVPSTGQTIGDADRTEVFGCHEVVLSVRAATRANRALGSKALKNPEIAHHLELMSQGVYFNSVERYLPFFYEQQGTLTDYLSPNTLVVVAEPRALFDDAARRYDELVAAAKTAGVSAEGLVMPPARIDLGGHRRLTMLSLLRSGGVVDVEIVARRPEVSGGEERLIGGIRALLDVGHTVVLTVPDRRTRRRIGDALVDAGVPVVDMPSASGDGGFSAGKDGGFSAGKELRNGANAGRMDRAMVYLSAADVPAGFVIPDARLAVVSIDDIYPRSAVRKQARYVDPTRMSFAFAPGDYVVHSTHGIALFVGMQRNVVSGVERDYVVLEYAKGDRLYVPVEQIDRVSKYVGADGGAPRITRLNTADWSKATGKARKAARRLAFDLVDLYARRAAVDGHAFAPDTPWQLEMEAMFPYVETPDQLAAIADVKADMESGKPMDRLICGDVGYGKTEVAIRAAFKATQDDKQVMVLCPTTILAQQHFTNFSERFEPFGVRVEVLSRFRTPSQQAEALVGFASGKVDVLIGTHRLLSRDVSPHALGLVIIDEEQRFGVEHKEHLKNLREQVDVLTMSATPIPRTLQMSLSGVRDISVIDTPPPNRFPVQVHVGEWDEDVVSGAIRRELERGGQVYYVSNRVKSINDAVERVRRAAPEARIGVAHGKMNEKQLERVMEAFAANEYDVLVATTIIESGIDNPHSNTLIIEDSQRLGLAQLYQLKGRVGRSHVRAFAYFLFPSTAVLTEQAVERLTTIRENTELGSGIKVAMRDLEIRGAGSLLGGEQSGNLSAVGFDLFAEMLREAIAEARGEPTVAFPDIKVDLPIAAFLPEEYVADVDERVRYYRRLAGSPSLEAVEAVVAELLEAHGAMPEPARNLADIARIKALAAEAGFASVAVVRNRLRLSPVTLTPKQRALLVARGAVIVEREQAISLGLDCGASVTEFVHKLLGAILAEAESA